MIWVIGILALCFIITVSYLVYTPYNKISIKESLDLANVPVITFINNGKKLNFLLDTGANRSVINKADLEGCLYEEISEKNTLAGIDGNNNLVENIVMHLSYKSSNYSEVMQVSDMTKIFGYMKKTYGVTVNGILGNSFFEKYQYVIDFKELVVYSKRKL